MEVQVFVLAPVSCQPNSRNVSCSLRFGLSWKLCGLLVAEGKGDRISFYRSYTVQDLNPFAPGDFAEKRVLKLVEWFSGHCRAIKS